MTSNPALYLTATHLREATPYIRAYSHKKIAVLLNSPSFTDEHLTDIAQDLALLYSLKVQPIIIINPEAEIREFLKEDGLCAANLTQIQSICHKVMSTLIAKLSLGLINSNVTPMSIPAISGNFVVAKPKGIIDGKDLQFYGGVRKIKNKYINDLLESQFMVMMTPFGFSPSGETYYIDPYDLTLQLSQSLEVEKIVVLGESVFRHENGDIMREWRPSLELAPESLTPYQANLVHFSTQALMLGIQRIHLLLATEPGALVQELFTRDGCGTMATLELYEQIRNAKPDDTGGIVELLQPLEQKGILVKRPLEQIEAEINHYTVIEREHSIIGCCAFYPYEGEIAELACFVVSPRYRSRKQGDAMLDHIIRKAHSQGIKRIFVLTTQTADWFMERGFAPAQLEDLPVQKQKHYNIERNSKIFIKTL
ncbi:MAG: amino-acid N-acetyltransferase [Pseudomonadota bacterium]|nr:amino-acid N-acetyltransferase [Pseudomonadota bacterium]|tara:strand:- start:727 stop:1998 length:1272 start_codon:yes stop_codon:yes gene_type:complete